MDIPLNKEIEAVGTWNTFPQPITTRGEATIFHTIDPNAPPGNRGAGGGVSGPILAAMMQESATLATITALRHTEQIMGTLEININYIRRASGKQIFAKANVLKKGKTVSFVEVDIYNDEERLVCNGHVIIGIKLSGGYVKPNKFEHENFENILNMFWKSNEHYGYELKLMEKKRGYLKFELNIGQESANVDLDNLAQILPGAHDFACVNCVSTMVDFENGEYMNGTISLNLSYLKPYLKYVDLKSDNKKIEIISKVEKKLKPEEQIAFASCEVISNNEVLATGRIVYSVAKEKEEYNGAFSL